MDRPELDQAIAEVRRVIAEACHRAGRSVNEVTLIGASKTVPVSTIEAARAAGLRDFGENYARDLGMKAAAVDATWHFIGALQRGTSAIVARHAHVVHAAEPGSGLATLARRVAAGGKTMPCLVEVDFTGRRHGLAPEAVPSFLDEAAGTSGIKLVGLMTIPPLGPDAEAARPFFARLRDLRDSVARDHPGLRELSMGMSLDYSVAVEEGATMVRVGTALFGPRPSAPR